MSKLAALLCAAIVLAALPGGAGAQQTEPAHQPASHDMPHMLDQAIFAHLLIDQLAVSLLRLGREGGVRVEPAPDIFSDRHLVRRHQGP